MQQKNFLLFLVIMVVILAGWSYLSNVFWPPPPKPNPAEVVKTDETGKPLNEKGDDKKPDHKKADDKKPDKKGPDKKAEKPAPIRLPDERPRKLLTLGDEDRHSKFHLRVLIDTRGAGVRSVLLNKFQAANDLGQPEWLDPETKKNPRPLELVPQRLNARSPSFLLYDYDIKDDTDDKPFDTLGNIEWKEIDRHTEEATDDRPRREFVSLQARTQGVIVTKTFSLAEGEYHLGLEVKMRRAEGTDKNIRFRYQLTGAHGLPVEGKWYTSIFRNALIGWVDKDGDFYRDLQDLRQIIHWAGGKEIDVTPQDKSAIVYAGVANQYFASVIAVDADKKSRAILRHARPTLETALTRGVVTSVAENGSSFVLRTEKGDEQTFYLPEQIRLHADASDAPGKGVHVAVRHHTGPYNERTREYPEIVTNVYTEPNDARQPLWEDDITVRVTTEPVELKGTDEVVHNYLLYHGPVKVSQLSGPPGLATKPLEEGGVSPELVARYHDDLHLNTLTDYHSPGVMGRFASSIYWTALVIKCTNLMHMVLGYLRAVIPSYGLCIIVLTILVRGMMFPLSRKQAMMSLRMQQLAPELKKLQEKHKDDRQALGMAQMDLYRKHGVNPFGSCWVLLLQMPIFMGLYFALQESIHFRLAEFWPTWINNLAAPDMLFGWSKSIPWISRDADYGSFLYLGPYFNLLPVIAVALMIVQQKMMTPPPADEQQAMQQKMMKYMMVFFGLMFYKVAAGLCLYFIASSIWGFCERKLLPKKKPELREVTAEGYFQKLLRKARGEQAAEAPDSTAVTTMNGGSALETRVRSGGKRARNRRRQAQASAAESAEDGSMLGRWRKRLREWWTAVLKEAEKKNRG